MVILFISITGCMDSITTTKYTQIHTEGSYVVEIHDKYDDSIERRVADIDETKQYTEYDWTSTASDNEIKSSISSLFYTANNINVVYNEEEHVTKDIVKGKARVTFWMDGDFYTMSIVTTSRRY